MALAISKDTYDKKQKNYSRTGAGVRLWVAVSVDVDVLFEVVEFSLTDLF